MPDSSRIPPTPIELGEVAPDFSLPSAQGGVLTLTAALQRGPVLLWFAPGMV